MSLWDRASCSFLCTRMNALTGYFALFARARSENQLEKCSNDTIRTFCSGRSIVRIDGRLQRKRRRISGGLGMRSGEFCWKQKRLAPLPMVVLLNGDGFGIKETICRQIDTVCLEVGTSRCFKNEVKIVVNLGSFGKICCSMASEWSYGCVWHSECFFFRSENHADSHWHRGRRHWRHH